MSVIGTKKFLSKERESDEAGIGLWGLCFPVIDYNDSYEKGSMATFGCIVFVDVYRANFLEKYLGCGLLDVPSDLLPL